jgi:hypothetical protein
MALIPAPTQNARPGAAGPHKTPAPGPRLPAPAPSAARRP